MTQPAQILVLAALVVMLALGSLYIGTTHRDRCLKAGNTGCSILPWSGQPNSGFGGAASGWKVVP